MYFSEKQPNQHEDHYRSLLVQFDAAEDPEFCAACYLVAHPDVFAALPEGKLGSNPFTWYWGPYDQEREQRAESFIVDKLPAGLKELVRAGVELFAGRPLHFELVRAASVWEAEEVRLFQQMLALRRGENLNP